MKNRLFQLSTIVSLATGNYEGILSIKELLEHGSFGIGTFNQLAGEMVIVDGIVYQMNANGTINKVKSSELTPFASVCDFEPTMSFKIDVNADKNTVLDQVLEKINENGNHFVYALKISGHFSSIKTRTVAQQTPPFKPLIEVVKDQSINEFTDQKGYLIGFYTPQYLSNVGVEGFHLHFINKTKTGGGHLFNFTSTNLTIDIAQIADIKLHITSPGFVYHAEIQDEIDQAEKSH